MEKCKSKEIIQPSDLFGLEILPECTFESEYGKLTIRSVFVPDFSSDEKGAVRLKKEFDNLKSFIEEKDLSKKLGIIDRIHENELSSCIDPSGYLILSVDESRSMTFSEFIYTLRANMLARLFELGIYISSDICKEFGYNCSAKLSSGMIHYNDIPIIQPLSCAGGVYAYGLKYALNPDAFCPPDYEDLKDEIIINGIPTHNYLSWAFYCASADQYMISFVSYVHFWLF